MRWTARSLIFVGLLVAVSRGAQAQCYFCQTQIRCTPQCEVDHTCTTVSGPCTNCTTLCDPGPGMCQKIGPNGCQWSFRAPAAEPAWLRPLRSMPQARCTPAWLDWAAS